MRCGRGGLGGGGLAGGGHCRAQHQALPGHSPQGYGEAWRTRPSSDLVQHARQQRLGDLPRRTALRVPGQGGDRRRGHPADVRGVRRRRGPYGGRAGRRRPRQGRPAGAAVRTTAGSSRCWTSPPPGPAWCWCRSTSCSAPTRSRSSSTTPGRAAFVVEDALVPVAEQGARGVARARSRRGPSRLADGDVPDGWTDLADWFAHDGHADRTSPVDDDDPVRLMYTSGTESRPKGALLSQPVADVAVRHLRRSTADEHRRRRAAHAAAVPLRAARLLPRRRTSTSAPPASSCRRPTRPRSCATIERERVTKFFARRRCGSRCCATPTSTTPTCRSLRKGYYGASPMPVEVLEEMQRRLPDVQLWNFYGQTEMAPLATILGPGRAAAPRRLGRPRGAQRRDPDRRRPTTQPCPPGTVGEIVHRSPARDARLLQRRGEDRRGVPRRLVPLRRPRRTSTRTATSTSSTARRT